MSDKVPERTEQGWLIEKMDGGQVWYVTVDQLLTWATDSLKALRLARRQDADTLCEIIEDAEKVAGHQWG